MAALKDEVKRFIVQALACFDTPTQVVQAVKETFGLDVTRQQCELYDPTKYAGRDLGVKWRTVFEDTSGSGGWSSKPSSAQMAGGKTRPGRASMSKPMKRRDSCGLTSRSVAT